jgi:hypothetical protein
MVVVPGVPPVIMPVPVPIVAVVVLAVLQAPPVVISLSVAVRPVHMRVVPLMAAGCGLTVTVAVAAQPLASV